MRRKKNTLPERANEVRSEIFAGMGENNLTVLDLARLTGISKSTLGRRLSKAKPECFMEMRMNEYLAIMEAIGGDEG